jgi:hypothetical protein
MPTSRWTCSIAERATQTDPCAEGAIAWTATPYVPLPSLSWGPSNSV